MPYSCGLDPRWVAADYGGVDVELPPFPSDPPPPYGKKHPQRPENQAGGVVGLDLMLAHTQSAAVRVQHLVAFPTGFEFQVVAQFRTSVESWDHMRGLAGLRGKPGDAPGLLSDEHLRLAVEFSDGRRATNEGPPIWFVDAEAQGPMLHPGDGGASALRVWTTYWAWPLPPPGPLTFVCAWPQFGIEPTRREVDSRLLLSAAAQAFELWAADDADQQS